jgi:protoporphyrinogen oxidase
MDTRPIVIIGAGMAGLGAADRLRRAQMRYLLIEQQDGPGGLVRTDRVDNYFFDRAGHFIHTRTPHFAHLIKRCGIRFRTFERRSAILIGGAIVPYPLQYNLWAAPPQIAEAVRRELDDLPMTIDLGLAFDEILKRLWGPTLTKHFFLPYYEKMWRVPLSELPSDWEADFVPRRDPSLIEQGLEKPITGYGYNSAFLYPASGRIGEFAESIAQPHARRLRLKTAVVAVDLAGETVRLSDGQQVPFSALISTVPLPTLLMMLGHPAEGSLFRHSNMINLRVGFRGAMLRPEHWYYVPDPAIPFFRVGFPSNVADGTSPPGCCSVSLEYGIGSQRRLTAGGHELAVEALEYLASHQTLKWYSIEVVDAYLIAPAYVAHRMSTTPRLQNLARNLERHGIYVAGRYGSWDYLSLEQAYLNGWQVGKHLMRRRITAASNVT